MTIEKNIPGTIAGAAGALDKSINGFCAALPIPACNTVELAQGSENLQKLAKAVGGDAITIGMNAMIKRLMDMTDPKTGTVNVADLYLKNKGPNAGIATGIALGVAALAKGLPAEGSLKTALHQQEKMGFSATPKPLA